MKYVVIFLLAPFILNAQIPIIGDIDIKKRDAHELLSEFDFQDLNYIYDRYPANEQTVMKIIPTHSGETLWMLVEFVYKGDTLTACKEKIHVDYFDAYRDTYGAPDKVYEANGAKFRVYERSDHTSVIRLALSDTFFTIDHQPK